MTKQELRAFYRAAKEAGDTEGMAAAKRLAKRLQEGKPTEVPMTLREDEPAGLGAMRQFAQGAGLGFADESEAALSGAHVEDIRAANQAYREQSPGTALAANLAGGLTTGAGLGGLAGVGMNALARGAGPATNWLLSNPITQGAMIGAGEGAVAGAGSANEGDRLQGAQTGGVTGGLFGGAAGLGASLLPRGRQGQVAADYLRGGKDTDAALAELDALNEGFDQSWAMLADVNPDAARVARDAASPEQAGAMSQAMRQRQRQQAPIMEDATRAITGIDDTRTAANQAMVDQRRQQGREMYAPLRGEAVQPTDEMMQTLATPDGQAAAARALRALQTTRRNPDLELDDVADDFEFWHNYQQVLRDTGANKLASSAPLTGPEAMAVNEMRQDVMTDLFEKQDWGDAYQKATIRYRENSAVLDAMTDSEKFARMSRDELEAAVGKLGSDEERAAFAAGVVNDIIEKAMRSPDGADIAVKLIRTPQLRANLETVIGAGKADKLDDAMQRLSRMTQTKNRTLEGSQTSTNLIKQEIAAGGGGKTPMQQLLNLQFGDAMMGALGSGGNRVMPPAIADKMAQAAILQDPVQIRRMLAELEGYRSSLQALPGIAAGGVTGATQ